MAANISSLQEFLELLACCFKSQDVNSLKELRLVAGPVSGHGGARQKQEWLANFKTIEHWLKSHQFWSKVSTDLKLREFSRGGGRDYHDRLITAESCLEKKGKAKGKMLIIEMTGGIDILMDARETTRVFICQMPLS